MMDIKGCMEITCKYYSKWLGQDEILTRDFSGAEYVYSEQRNIVQYGYGTQFDLYVLCQKGRTVVSFGDTAAASMDILKREIGTGMQPAEIRRLLERLFGRKTGHSIKYVLGQLPIPAQKARVLTPENYGQYRDFWQKCYQNDDTEGLEEYFDEMAQEHTCVGVFADGVLASCTDAPGMPYMENQVREIGINTLPEYRGRGYASEACKKCIEEILNHNKVPLWSTSVENKASRRLAEKTGFSEFAEVITMTL